MAETYLVTIEETSMENLSNRDRVMLKDTGDAIEELGFCNQG